jgi:hypothetical protein
MEVRTKEEQRKKLPTEGREEQSSSKKEKVKKKSGREGRNVIGNVRYMGILNKAEIES